MPYIAAYSPTSQTASSPAAGVPDPRKPTCSERASPAQQARTVRTRAHKPTTRRSRASPRPTPRTAALSPRSRSQPCRPHHERASPAQQRVRRQSPCTHTNRSPESVPAPPHAAHSRAEPEEPHRSAGALQTRAAPSKRRPQPVRSARTGAKCKSPRVTWMHDGHNLSCDTVAHVTLDA